jgi:putative flippase GtrA
VRSGRLRTGWAVQLRELGAFGVVGAVCFVLDLSLFQVLYTSMDLGAVTSKVIATVLSMTAAFVGHRYWSFSRRVRSGLRREYALFFGVNGLTLAMGALMIAAVRYPLDQDGAWALQLTNLASIALGTAFRFVLYRRWVFLAPGGLPAADHGAPQTGSPQSAPSSGQAPRPGRVPDRLDVPASATG